METGICLCSVLFPRLACWHTLALATLYCFNVCLVYIVYNVQPTASGVSDSLMWSTKIGWTLWGSHKTYSFQSHNI